MLSLVGLSMRFGGKILFKDVNLQLNPGQHYGLVGANGSGKSTLIKILSREMTPEAGDVAYPTQFSVGTLKQDQFLYEDTKILDVVLMGKPQLWKAWQDKDKLFEKEEFTETECHILDDLEKIIADHHGYTAPSEAAKLLEGLGLETSRHEMPMHTLSGGYKLRVLLARLLFSHPDILLLDEPTNHLDIISIRWLEEYLKDFPGTLLVSSHDRHFLNTITDYIVDVDYQTMRLYKGNFDQFLITKQEYRFHAEKAREKHEKRRDDVQDFVDRFKAKASKARQAQSKAKMVDRLNEEINAIELAPSSRLSPILRFDLCRPSGVIALKVNGISKSYGTKKVLHDVSFEVERGDRIGFIGPNGIGKSTLLEILMENNVRDSGTFEWGFATHIAYFQQDLSREVSGTISILDWLGQFDKNMSQELLRNILGRVLFTKDDVEKPVNVLSGGETARLILAKMMVLKHNVLIFDEPTNHLDMEAIETLLEALKTYEGTILFVSHNRYFVSNLANRIIEMTDKGLKDFRCTFEEYLEKQQQDHLAPIRKKVKEVESPRQSNPSYDAAKNDRKNKSQQEKKAAAAEEKCHKIEVKIKELDDKLATEGFYSSASQAEIQKLLSEKEALEKALESAMADWEKASY